MENGIDINKEQLVQLLSEPFKAEWLGTCEVCGHRKQLAERCGLYLCEQCCNTITARIKDGGHPFALPLVSITLRMDPALRGNGVPGERQPLHPESALGKLMRETYQRALLENAREQLRFLTPRSQRKSSNTSGS